MGKKVAKEGPVLQEGKQEFSIHFRAAKGWKADAASLSKLGFDVSISPSFVRLRKVHSFDILGKPHLFTEVEVRKNSISVRYSCPKESDPKLRRMHACLVLMQIAFLLPGAFLEAKALSLLLLPSLEQAAAVASLPYESLSKIRSDLEEKLSELSEQNKRLLQASQSSMEECIALERKLSTLSLRVSQLERVSDPVLDEMLLEWLSSHKGRLNIAHFSAAHNIPPARCEERLGALMKKGIVSKVGGAFHVESSLPQNEYQVKRGILQPIFGLFKKR